MFTIDLLKGQAIPIKSGPERLVFAAATAAGPVIAVILVLGMYLSNAVAISVHRQGIAGCDDKMARPELAEALAGQERFEQNKSLIQSCLQEVSTVIGRHAQWSPVLQTVVQYMPDSVVLTKLEVKQESIKQRYPKNDDPEQMVEVSIPVRKLQMSVCSNTKMGCDKAVRDFRDQLLLSPALGPKLENIKVEQSDDKLDDRQVVSYQINCLFKPGF